MTCAVILWRSKPVLSRAAEKARIVHCGKASVCFCLPGCDGSDPARFVAAGENAVTQHDASVRKRLTRQAQAMARHHCDASKAFSTAFALAGADGTETVTVLAVPPACSCVRSALHCLLPRRRCQRTVASHKMLCQLIPSRQISVREQRRQDSNLGHRSSS